ncbi:MAG: DUF6502 family protein [Marinicellaceae bacterium]
MNNKLDKMLSYLAYRLFKPIVTIFLRNLIPYKTAAKWLKQAYVDVAQNNKEFAVDGKKHTKSRIAVITGLTRVDVDKVLKMDSLVNASEQNWNRATKVISGWISDSDYLEMNEPKELPLVGDISFESLVKKYSGGITARAVLDELKHINAISVEKNTVTLLQKEYIYLAGKDQAITLENISLSAGGLLDTLTYNTNINNHDKKFQRSIIQRNVPDSLVKPLEIYIKDESAFFLHTLDQKLTQKIKNTEQIDEPTENTIGLGLYYYED